MGRAGLSSVIGLPSAGSYAPYESFAQDWYERGDWYGQGQAGARPGTTGGNPAGLIYDGIGLGREAGGLDGLDLPSRPLSSRGSPYFRRGYSPYSGYRDFGDESYLDNSYLDNSYGNNFYDDDFYDDPYDPVASDEFDRAGDEPRRDPLAPPGSPASRSSAFLEDSPSASSPATQAETPPTRANTRINTPRRNAQPDDLYEDYDTLLGGYGNSEYVNEGGGRDRPNFGAGPRYRGYYSEDWLDDQVDFNDWYDGVAPR